MIKDCILSTDLASFFGNKAKLNAIVDKNEFSWKNSDHRYVNKSSNAGTISQANISNKL